MFFAILILLSLPFADLSRSRGTQFKPFNKIAYFIFAGNLFILMVLGAKHVESPFIEFGQIATVLYFIYFLLIVPFFNLLENAIIEGGITYKDAISISSQVYYPRLFLAKLFLVTHPIVVSLSLSAATFLYSLHVIWSDVLLCVNDGHIKQENFDDDIKYESYDANRANPVNPANPANHANHARITPWNTAYAAYTAHPASSHRANAAQSSSWNSANAANAAYSDTSNLSHVGPLNTTNISDADYVDQVSANNSDRPTSPFDWVAANNHSWETGREPSDNDLYEQIADPDFDQMLAEWDAVTARASAASAEQAPGASAEQEADASSNRSRSTSRSASPNTEYRVWLEEWNNNKPRVQNSERSPSPNPNHRECLEEEMYEDLNYITGEFETSPELTTVIDPDTGREVIHPITGLPELQVKYNREAFLVRSLRASEIDSETNTSPMEAYQELIFMAKYHAMDDTIDERWRKWTALRSFIHSNSNGVEGESLPCRSRSEIVSSLNALYMKALRDMSFTSLSPSSIPFNVVDWTEKHCWDGGLNRYAYPGPPSSSLPRPIYNAPAANASTVGGSRIITAAMENSHFPEAKPSV